MELSLMSKDQNQGFQGTISFMSVLQLNNLSYSN